MSREIKREIDTNDAQYQSFERVIKRAGITLDSLRRMPSPDSRGYVDWRIALEHLSDLVEITSESLRNNGAYSQLTMTLVRSTLFFDRDCRNKYFGGRQ